MALKGAAEIAAETEQSAVRTLRRQADEYSWKDEAWTIALILPILMAFFPVTQPWAREGFKILELVPWYFQGLLAIGLCYGFHRKVVSLFGLVRGVGK